MELWITFVLAATLILIIPGPTIILVISQAVNHGRRSVLPLAAGVMLGDFTAMTLSLLGLGALLSASAVLFSIFKWIGAVYLVYLGIRLWKRSPEERPLARMTKSPSGESLFKSAYIVTALNPKSIAFFVAFLPQFINLSKPVLPQFALFGGTFLFIGTVNAALYALFAGQLRESIRKEKVRRWLNRCGGSALIGAGLFMAGVKRSS